MPFVSEIRVIEEFFFDALGLATKTPNHILTLFFTPMKIVTPNEMRK